MRKIFSSRYFLVTKSIAGTILNFLGYYGLIWSAIGITVIIIMPGGLIAIGVPLSGLKSDIISVFDSFTYAKYFGLFLDFFTLKGFWSLFPFFQSLIAISLGNYLLNSYPPKFLRSAIYFFRFVSIYTGVIFLISFLTLSIIQDKGAINMYQLEKSLNKIESPKSISVEDIFNSKFSEATELLDNNPWLKEHLGIDNMRKRVNTSDCAALIMVSFILYLLTLIFEYIDKWNWKWRFTLFVNGFGEADDLKVASIIEHRNFLSKKQILDIVKKSDNRSGISEFEKLALYKFSKDKYFVEDYFRIKSTLETARAFYLKKIKFKRSVQKDLLKNESIARIFITANKNHTEYFKYNLPSLINSMPPEIKNDSNIFDMAFYVNSSCIIHTNYIHNKEYVLQALRDNPDLVFEKLNAELKRDEEVRAAYLEALSKKEDLE